MIKSLLGQHTMLRYAVAMSAGLVLLGAATPARAGLTLCNKTQLEVAAAVGFFLNDAPGTSTGGERGGTVHGWTKIGPGECVLIDRSVANRGEFFYYAESQPHGRQKWGGTSRLCVRAQAFKDQQLVRMGNASCPSGWRAEGFQRVDSTTVESTRNLIQGD